MLAYLKTSNIMTKSNKIQHSIAAVHWKKASLVAFFIYTIFALDFLSHGQENSLKIFYLKLLVVTFMITKYIFKWSPGFSVTRKISQFTAVMTRIYLPVALRAPIYSTFAAHYGIITKDMVRPYRSYKNFNAFFTRAVKSRRIDPNTQIAVSPADAKILSISEVKSNDCLLVKGINYKVGHFLSGYKNYIMDQDELNAHYRQHEGSTFWSVILYLAPGDYHRYHCPVDFLAQRRTHIIGCLAPVKESYVSTTPGIYEGNERVVMQGNWSEGVMFVTFVGATNVGSMTINFDDKLITNQVFPAYDVASIQEYNSVQFKSQVPAPYKKMDEGVQIPKGAEIGKFNMGSTVVLIFESKQKVTWNVKAGEKVRYGQSLFTLGGGE